MCSLRRWRGALAGRDFADSPIIKFPTTPAGIIPEPQPKDYFFDGTGLYQLVNASGDVVAAHLYIGMRRGGRFIYALDVTDPGSPRFMWKRGCYPSATGVTCDPNFESMGQTWSEPKVARVRGHSNPVLIFGGGFDNVAEDPETVGTTTMGNVIFVLDAKTGATVKTFKDDRFTKSFAADITLVDRDRDENRYIDRLYATDLGANVWRLDIDAASTAEWTVNKLASLSTALNSRKIFYPADVVPTKTYDAVMVGTGDREHPLITSASALVENRFYMLKDEDVSNTVALPYSTIVDRDDTSPSDLFDATTSPYDGTKRGWFVKLRPGEKVVNAPTTFAGYVNFGTNQPTENAPGQCSNLGIARGYKADFV